MKDHVDVDEDAPPAGTAIVRPMRHVKAVRERHAEQLAARSPDGESRSARAWSWALGETPIAPVTDRVTVVPPSRADIEVEIGQAEERRLRGDREHRADGAATLLRWLIGEDDHLPVRGPNRGELVGGFGGVVRSPAEIADLIGKTSRSTCQPNDSTANVSLSDSDNRGGFTATLIWVLSRDTRAPISGELIPRPTTHDLKVERLGARDMIERRYELYNSGLSSNYCLGVKRAVDWLLGDSPHPIDAGAAS